MDQQEKTEPCESVETKMEDDNKTDDDQTTMPENDIPKVKKPSLAKLYKKEMTIGEIRESYKKTKKYAVLTPSWKLLHFGNWRQQHYSDLTTLGIFRGQDHKSGIKKDKFLDKHKDLIQDPENPFHYEAKYLYGYGM